MRGGDDSVKMLKHFIRIDQISTFYSDIRILGVADESR